MFFTIFMAATGLIWTVQVVKHISFLTTSRQTFLTTLKFSALFIPSATQLVMPFAFVIAIAQTFSTMNQDSELVIVNAIDSPCRAIWRPVLLLGIMLSILSFITANFITPHARLHMRKMIAAANSTLINMLIQEGSFHEVSKNIYLEIGERRPNSSIGRLVLIDQSHPDFDLFYCAVSGMLTSNKNGHVLVMNNGEVQRRDNKNGRVSIIKFDSYTFDLSEFTPANQMVIIYPKDRFLTYLFKPDLDDPYYQQHPMRYTTELHRRLTEWFYPLVFSLVALVASSNAHPYRERRISVLVSAILLSLFIYWLGYFFAERAVNNLAYLPCLYLIPFGISALLIYMLFTNRHVGFPVRCLNAVFKITAGILSYRGHIENTQ
ncbi:MAG: lipopolysaccharide export system permease protein [Candidatus Tokpelaia sp. JSC085]|nr:MAG: lipopolysaccharide export system permease protein [Candidatus Tokpelaia sp. JSC085]